MPEISVVHVEEDLIVAVQHNTNELIASQKAVSIEPGTYRAINLLEQRVTLTCVLRQFAHSYLVWVADGPALVSIRPSANAANRDLLQ
jgi:hypothetical protein